MKKNRTVLLVSPYTYSLSSRGMDVLTNCFEEENWTVDHLTFPRMFISPEVSPPSNTSVKCINARRTYFPYIDRIMFWFPKVLFDFVKYLNNRKAIDVNFSEYDLIVLESGKPLFLMDIIPENIPLIYRLSDSVQFVLGKNKHYCNLEKAIFERSHKMIFKKAIYKSFLEEPHQQDKVTVIENGMVIPEDLDPNPSFPENTLNAVYVGLHQLDFLTLKGLLVQRSDCNFYIIGPCLLKSQIKRLAKFSNFHYFPFLSKEKYMPLLRDATVAIFPFKRSEKMKWFGLTSKFLHFMYFLLPIISYPTGIKGEFKDLPVQFADSRDDFISLTMNALKKPQKIEYDIDFTYYSSNSRKNEYKEFIRKI